MDVFTDLQGNLTRVTNRINVQNVQDDANQSSLGTTSLKAFRVRATVPEAKDHLPVLEIAKNKPEEPLGNLQGYQDPHDDVVVDFVKRI